MLKTVLLIVFLNVLYNPVRAQLRRQNCLTEIYNGNELLWQFKPREAIKRYNKAMQQARALNDDSLYALAQFGAGQAIWYNGNFAEAITSVRDASEQFRKINDKYNTTASLRVLSNIYDDIGDYENAFKTVTQALDIFKDFHDDQNEMLSLIQIGSLYKNIGDFKTAMSYYQKVIDDKPRKGDYSYRELYHRLGELYAATNKIDSARFFYEKAFFGNRNSRTIRTCIGQSYLLQHNTEKAFAYFNPLLTETVNTGDVNIQILVSLGLAEIYLIGNDLSAAIGLAEDALVLSTQRGQRQNKRDAYQLLSKIYAARGDYKNALQHEKRFQQIKDSLLTDQFKGQLYSFKQQAAESEQLATLRAENKTAVRSLIFICLAAAFVIVVIILRHKNEKLRLDQRASDLETQALRAQMNPHFVFNCLTAINHFVLANETEKASQYLTRFARLLRMVLINAGKNVITLEEEIAILKLYLDMEQLRFKDAFCYSITYDKNIQPSMVNLPSFILQPFCENAIWHGLLHKDGIGKLDIHCRIEGEILLCTITDNGVGRDVASRIRAGSLKEHSSLGQKLSAERLALYNGKKNDMSSFTITDLQNPTGTRVTLTIKQTIKS